MLKKILIVIVIKAVIYEEGKREATKNIREFYEEYTDIPELLHQLPNIDKLRLFVSAMQAIIADLKNTNGKQN